MEAQVFKGRHSITASCSQQSDSETESEEEIKPTRKVFQAKVQKLLAVRWFTQKRGVRYRHLRKSGCCTDVAPTPEEEALLGKVLSSRHLMHKTTEMLQSFQREISGVDGFFDELGVQPSWVGRLEDSLFADDKKESLMKLAVKAIHQAKWMSLRICYNDHMKQQEQELKVLKQNYEKLRQQFAEVRQDYLQEVATLRDQVRIRGDVETAGWMDESGGDVVYFFDPAKALTPKETHFVLHAVKEKLMMILEQNPRIGGAGGPVDLGQLEKLKDLKENKELEDLRSELVKRSQELIEAQRALRKLQEEMEKAQTLLEPGRNKHRFERMVLELEDKVSQLRHDAGNLKRQLHSESKERHHAEQSLAELKAEHKALCETAEELERQQSLSESEVRALRAGLDFAQARWLDLQDSETAWKAKMEALQQSHDELVQALKRKPLHEGHGTETSESDPFQDVGLTSFQPDSSEGKRQQNSDGSDGLLEEAHQQVIEALRQKDLSVAKCEDLRRENSQLKRELMRQSRGVLLMEAENNSQNANGLSSFLSSLQDRLSASPRASSKSKALNLSFPELEERLAEATTKASSSLKAVLQGLQKRRQLEPGVLQSLQEESLRSQREKQLLEQELFELRLQHLTKGMGALNPRSKGDEEKLQALVACSLQFLQSMSQEMQLLANENTLRESLLSFSSSLSQASSMVSARGNRELESILSSITANAECAVPAVFSRLFNDSRKLDPRLEQQAQERRESLMKSLILHLSEDRFDEAPKPVDHHASLRRTGGFEDQEEPQVTTSRPRLLHQRSTREELQEAPATSRPRLLRQRSLDVEDLPSTHRPPHPPHLPHSYVKQRTMEEPSAPSVPRRSFLDDEHEGAQDLFNATARSSWSRQCSGSEVSSSSQMSSTHRAFLGITSFEFKSNSTDGASKARKLRIPGRKPEGLMLPQVPMQAGHSPVSSEQPLSCRDSGDHDERSESDAMASSSDEQDAKPLPRVAVKPPAQDRSHFFQMEMAFQDRRISVSDLKPPESWPSRMKNALTGRRLSHLVARPEPDVHQRRRSSVS